jgi:4-hydroxy-3-methylbut-2-enyl diphosphate reductase
VVEVTDEDEYFPPPPELRELVRAVSVAVQAALAAPPAPADDAPDDRSTPASRVLASLSG